MNALWIHRSMEQLQHLMIRRSCNGIARQEVIASWMAIQREVAVAIDQMDKEYESTIDALSPEEKTRNQPLLGHNRRR